MGKTGLKDRKQHVKHRFWEGLYQDGESTIKKYEFDPLTTDM